MLFFKDIVKEKMADKAFRQLYKEECHICEATIKIVAKIEEDGAQSDLFEKVNISPEQYDALKQGDKCVPEAVLSLCNELEVDTNSILKNCPRLKRPGQ